MTETLEYRARQYAAELGNERLAELVLDLVDEIDTLHGRIRELEEEGVILRERGHDLKRQLNGALSAYSAAASESDRAGAAELSAAQAGIERERDLEARLAACVRRARMIALCGNPDRCGHCNEIATDLVEDFDHYEDRAQEKT
jgi:predicted  nucleic acid-binding Zn-ribbon protein